MRSHSALEICGESFIVTLSRAAAGVVARTQFQIQLNLL